MQTIYIDVLIVLNIYVNFMLLMAVSKITHSKIKKKRGIISAIYGSLYSLIILLPETGNFLNIFIKLFASVTIVFIAFGYGNAKRLILNTIIFFAVNFIFGGAIFAVYILLEPSFIHFNNTYFYVDFSLLLLIFVTAFLYTLISIFNYFSEKISPEGYKIIIKHCKKSVVINGFADTGNLLVDFFTGKPVIICGSEELSEIINLSGIKNAEDFLKIKGFRIIPYSTISGESMIPVFTPDEVFIVNDKNNFHKKADVLIGIKNNEEYAIFNPKLLKF